MHFVLSLLLGFLLGFFLEATIGMLGFWFLEVSSLLFVYMLFISFIRAHVSADVSGQVFVVGGVSWGDIVRVLPFQYLAYFPAAVCLGKITATNYGKVYYCVCLGAVVCFVLLSRLAYVRGCVVMGPMVVISMVNLVQQIWSLIYHQDRMTAESARTD